MPTTDVISKQLVRQVVKDLALYLRMLRYYTDIALAYPGLPIHQYVIYTGKAKLTMPNRITAPDWTYQYHLIDMHTLDCERFTAEDNPDALVLAILCDFKDKPPQQVLRGIIQRLIELTANQSDKLRNYLKMMELLSVNRDLQQTFQQVEKDMLSNIQVDQLPSYQIGMEKGLSKGLAEGIHTQATHTVKRMLQKGMAIDTIHQLTELPVSEIEQIADEIRGDR